MDALAPFRVDGPKQEPTPLSYLLADSANGLDLTLEVTLQSASMDALQTISRSNMKYLYWSMDQMLTHHTVIGCNMRTGDLCGTGTISGSVLERKRYCLQNKQKITANLAVIFCCGKSSYRLRPPRIKPMTYNKATAPTTATIRL
jgi:2-keto-4-pentenoate hydratase/2-oxohepta-3-ene-1,7-dioic acid hydratase in catechol pathway